VNVVVVIANPVCTNLYKYKEVSRPRRRAGATGRRRGDFHDNKALRGNKMEAGT